MAKDNERLEERTGSAEELAAVVREAFEQHLEGLWRFLYRMTGQEDDAQELLHETFIRAMKGSAGYRGGKASAWLFAIALNAARDRWRISRGTMGHLGEGAAASRETEPSESAGKAEVGRRVRKAVAGLPEPQRAAVLLSRFEGLAYADLARIEGCSEDAVKQRVRRAMEHLREELKGIE